MKIENFSFETFPDYNMPLFDVVDVAGDNENIRCKTEDVEYKKGLRIRFLWPDNELSEERRYPLLIFVQGSGWYPQNLSDHIFDLYPIIISGYAVAVIEHQGIPEGQFPEQILQVKEAISFIYQNRERFPVDTDNLFFGGDSSGGNLSMMTMIELAKEKRAGENIPYAFRGILDLYGVMDLCALNEWWCKRDYEEEGNIEDYLGVDWKDETLRKKASPFWQIEEGLQIPPILILHGSKDTKVPFTQSLAMHRKLVEMGYISTLIRVKGADHGLSIFYCDAVYEKILDFLNGLISY